MVLLAQHKKNYFSVCLVAFLVVFALFLPVITSVAQENNERKVLTEQVEKLELGMSGYVLARKLTPEQKKLAKEHLLGKAYPGTYKFQAEDVAVVVGKDTDRVLAIYRRQKGISTQDLKSAIGELMLTFGEPTTMAHSKIVYWAYGKDGLIDEALFEAAKKSGQIDIIATVKLNSSLSIDEIGREEVEATDNVQAEPAGKKKEEQEHSLYFIITSEPLLKYYLQQ